MQFQCPQCKAILASDGVTEGMKVTCPECQAAFEVKQYVRKTKLRAVDDTATGDGAVADGPLPDAIHSRVASAIGIEKLQGFKLSDLFAEVFSKHSREEVEDYFTVGTAKSTPDILEVDASWPKPWLFTRMMLASLVLYFLFWAGWRVFDNNPKLLSGWIMIGSFAIPISALVLFLELNIRRNVSLYMVARLSFLGGILSLMISLLFFSLFDLGFLGVMSAGPIEESGKVLAMIAVARAAKYRYKLNGLLVGAAVGVGFSAFESAGYALEFLVRAAMDSSLSVLEHAETYESLLAFGFNQGASTMESVLTTRGLLSPLAHIVWSAIAGCALWRVIDGRDFKWRMLCDENFIRLFIVPVVLHMIWNSPLELPFFGKYLLVGAAGWFVCLSLVQEGLHEVAAEQLERKEALEENAARAAKGGAQ
jgi:RsiW-degrading membrane proteinase PrsW (M82 family)